MITLTIGSKYSETHGKHRQAVTSPATLLPYHLMEVEHVLNVDMRTDSVVYALFREFQYVHPFRWGRDSHQCWELTGTGTLRKVVPLIGPARSIPTARAETSTRTGSSTYWPANVATGRMNQRVVRIVPLIRPNPSSEMYVRLVICSTPILGTDQHG